MKEDCSKKGSLRKAHTFAINQQQTDPLSYLQNPVSPIFDWHVTNG